MFARNVKVTVRRQAALPRLLNMALLLGAAALLWARHVPVPALTARFLPGSQWHFWADVGTHCPPQADIVSMPFWVEKLISNRSRPLAITLVTEPML